MSPADKTVVSWRIDTLTGGTHKRVAMTDRIAHDHPTVDTVDATLVRRGGTRKPEVKVSKSLEGESGTLVRLVIDGTEYRAPIEQTTDRSTVFRHAAPSPRLARNPETSTNALIDWIGDLDLSIGRTIAVDIVESGFKYGLRAPGDEAVYETGKPHGSLADIAREFDS